MQTAGSGKGSSEVDSITFKARLLSRVRGPRAVAQNSKPKLPIRAACQGTQCIWRSQGMFLTPSAVDELKQLGKRQLILYNALSVEAA
eukprot:8549792-Pyramimonas_sp.AAC.1